MRSPGSGESNASGGSILDGTGVVTIVDNDSNLIAPVLGADAVTDVASSAGLEVAALHEYDGRWFAVLVLTVIVAIPHAAIAWVGLETRDSLLKVFPEREEPLAVAPTTTTAPRPGRGSYRTRSTTTRSPSVTVPPAS